MNGIYLIIGGNEGDRLDYLQHARLAIEDRIGQIVHQSAVYESDSWGNEDQPAFLNQVIHVDTPLEPRELLNQCLAIELHFGRVRKTRWGNRSLDIDILYYNNLLMNDSGLKLPHPCRLTRRFVLTPLAEIAAVEVDPIEHKTIRELLLQCTDPLRVWVHSEI
jgi:2-amino-4-hydroxy-6-hydroxymethyldihydropteridine diphosphokinase